MVIVVPSIHHTGTNFVLQNLLRKFATHPNTIASLPPEQSKVHVHVEPSLVGQLDHWVRLMYPMLVPIRHPASVARSWKARGKPVSEMVGQWQMLIDQVAPFKPSYLPLDVDNREDWLEAFCDKFSLDLSTDWEVVRGSGIVITDPDAELNAVELSEIDSLMSSPFFEQFYPRNDNVLRIDARHSAQTRATAAPSG